MDQERRKQIVKALEAMNTTKPCSRCGAVRFEIVGESLIALQEDINSIVIGGPSVRTVIVACSTCGHVWQHAQSKLGLTGLG